MDDINEIQFEERNVSSAITWGIIAGVALGLMNYLLGGRSVINPYYDEISDNGILNADSLRLFLNLIVDIAITVWVVKIAKKLNRPPVLWGICAFLFPPITLIVIGFQDYKIEDKNIKSIVDETRLDFNTELLNIKNTQDLTSDELKQIEIKLKEKYTIYLRKKIQPGLSDKIPKSPNMTIQSDKKELTNVRFNEEESIQSDSDQILIGDINKCPACGAAINDKTVICPECGLTIA